MRLEKKSGERNKEKDREKETEGGKGRENHVKWQLMQWFLSLWNTNRLLHNLIHDGSLLLSLAWTSQVLGKPIVEPNNWGTVLGFSVWQSQKLKKSIISQSPEIEGIGEIYILICNKDEFVISKSPLPLIPCPEPCLLSSLCPSCCYVNGNGSSNQSPLDKSHLPYPHMPYFQSPKPVQPCPSPRCHPRAGPQSPLPWLLDSDWSPAS